MPGRDLIIRNIPEATFDKFRKLKDEKQYEDWVEFIKYLVRDVRLLDTTGEQIQKGTRDNLLGLWCKNFRRNLYYIPPMPLEEIRKTCELMEKNAKTGGSKSVADLVPEQIQKEDAAGQNTLKPYNLGSALIIGRGPSIFKHKHLDLLAKSNYKGTLMVTDGMLIECLKANVTPDLFPNFYVVTVDGNLEFIVKWYDHELVKQYGPKIKACIASATAYNAVEKAIESGMQIYWFQPLFDDITDISSWTKLNMYMTSTDKRPNGIPSTQCGGNCGATAWVIAHAIMRKNPCGLIGIDLGYLEETPLEETSYYKQALKITGGDVIAAKSLFKRIYNPYYKVTATADQIFYHYRESWLQMATECLPWERTINCTEGGTLHGDRIEQMRFAEFLEAFSE